MLVLAVTNGMGPQLQDRHGALVAAVEEQVAAQAAAWRTGLAGLRSELSARGDAAAGQAAERLEGLEGALRQAHADVQVWV